MSKHKFGDNIIPSKAENLDTRDQVALDRIKKFEQSDVMIMPLRNQKEKIPYMSFASDFTLKAGDVLWITRGGTKEERGTMGTLSSTGMTKGKFHSSDNPIELTMEMKKPVDVRGGSGLEIIHVESGLPIGVLLAANNGGKDATIVIFEPICLPIVKSNGTRK